MASPHGRRGALQASILAAFRPGDVRRYRPTPSMGIGRRFSITSAESGEPSDPFSGLAGLVNLGRVP
jgi:hypothetical protein